MISQITERIKQFTNPGRITNRACHIAIALTLGSLLLTTGQKIMAFDSSYDDILFLFRAKDLQAFRWLGHYNHMTLIKGMFYPLWIAVVHMAGIPLIISQHILYIFACIVTVIALSPWLQSSGMKIFLYSFLLLNPMSFDFPATRVLREGIYPSLTLLVVACSFALISRIDRTTKDIAKWSVGLGVSLSAFWLTREEGIWITPFLIIILGVASILLWRKKPVQWPKIVVLGALPFTILAISLGTVATVNKLSYGIFSTVEFKNSDFLDAYGALSRVKPSHLNPYYPVQKETREKIYSVSATFGELKPFLEGQVGAAWTATSCTGLGLCDDIGGGCFVWALREAVAASGHYESGKSAIGYYRRLASEINAACENGRLDCLPPRSTMMPVWHDEYNRPFVNAVIDSTVFLSKFSGFYVQPMASTIPMSLFDLFSTMTHDRISPPQTNMLNISGWAFNPNSSTLSFSVLKNDGEKADATLKRIASPDVYKYFFNKNKDIPGAREARFLLTTSCYPGCYLLIEPCCGIPSKIPLDGSVKGGETASLNFAFDNLSVAPTITSYSTGVDKAKIFILDKIGRFYQTIMPTLTILSFIGYCISTFFIVRQRLAPERWFVATALLIAIIVRIILLAILQTTSFPSINTIYLAPAYPLLLLFQFLALTEFVILFRNRSNSDSKKTPTV